MGFVPFGGNTIKSIQRGVTTITPGSGNPGQYTTTAAITSVDTSKSVVNKCGGALDTVWLTPALSTYATLTNATTVTVGCGQIGGAAYSARISWEVIEFN